MVSLRCFGLLLVQILLVQDDAVATSATTLETGENLISFPWCIPPTPYPPQVAREGDTVYFNWDGEYHNVYLYPSGTCTNKTGRVYLGEISGQAKYTFTDADVGKNLTFVCDVSSHCSQGQIVVFEGAEAFGLPATTDPEASATPFPYSTTTPCGDVYFNGLGPGDDGADPDASAAAAVGSGFLFFVASGAALLGL
ncbi:unnamed protein product [Pseudo-nitzschia multistriata]|uniref:Phytocyanin domain-containing protein n=1 Tax=Pseudo-nitzschia multistriata TaxID=183589 RepID=A0A448Z021_9STRA|nr:unnamed protein product [Pseudo-nitzschia multistriata]